MKKFINAFNGLKEGLKHRSILIQVILGLLAILGGLIVKLDYYEWFVFIVMIGLVITCEMINTCIEKVCDYLSKENDERIKTIKDLSAGFVLTISFTSFVVMLWVLVRRI